MCDKRSSTVYRISPCDRIKFHCVTAGGERSREKLWMVPRNNNTKSGQKEGMAWGSQKAQVEADVHTRHATAVRHHSASSFV